MSKSAVVFAPIGYPEVKPIKTAKPAVPESLNRNFVTGDMILQNILIPPSKISILLPIINGKREGRILLNQSIKPSLAAGRTI